MNPSAARDLERIVTAIAGLVEAHLCARSGTWAASFTELVAIAEDKGVPLVGMQPAVASLLGEDGAAEADGHEGREAVVEALIGRWAAHVALASPAVES